MALTVNPEPQPAQDANGGRVQGSGAAKVLGGLLRLKALASTPHTLTSPWRRPRRVQGSPIDKVLVGLFRLKALLGSVDDIWVAPETTISERLQVGPGFLADEGGLWPRVLC